MTTAVKLYSDAVDIYDRVHYSHGEDAEEVDAILSWFRKPGGRILDLGCGTGLHAVGLARKGHDVAGLDISEQAVEAARKRAEGTAGVTFHVADIGKDGLSGSGMRDLVISLGNTISHLGRERLAPVFDGVRRLLAPGGWFVFNTIYWSQPFRKCVVERDPAGDINVVWERKLDEAAGKVTLRGYFPRESYSDTIEVNCYKVPEIMNLLKSAGFAGLRWSDRLDFRGRRLDGVNTVFYRARAAGAGAVRRY